MASSSKRGWAMFVLCVALAGCAQKPAEEAKTTDSEATPGTPAAKTRPSGESQRRAPAQPRSAPAAMPVTVPAGTELEVRLITGLSSKANKAGDSFTGTLETPVAVGGKTAIPRGADVSGRVTSAVPSGRLKQRAELWVTLTNLRAGNRSYEIASSTTGHKEGSKATRDIIFIGGGSGAGAAIGAATGGGKGAGIGAAIGAAAGTAGAMMTGKREVEFPSESLLRFRLERDLAVRP